MSPAPESLPLALELHSPGGFLERPGLSWTPGREFMRTNLKATAISVGIGLLVFGLIAYALVLFSVTQNVARGTPAITTLR
jgi:hypothetical protein